MSLKSISFQINFIILICIAAIVLMGSISSVVISSSLSEVIITSEKASEEYNTTVKLSEMLNATNLSIIALIAEKDIDKLEKQVAELASKRKNIYSYLSECHFCKKQIINKFDEYDKKVNVIVNEKILLGKAAEAIDYFINNLTPVFSEVSYELNQIQNTLKMNLSQNLQNSKQSQKSTMLTIIISGVLSVLLSLAIGAIIALKIKSKLNSAVNTIENSSQSLVNTSDILRESSVSLSDSSMATASSLEQTVTTLTDISGLIDQNAEVSEKSAEVAKLSYSLVLDGQHVIDNLTSSVSKLNNSSIKINDITTMIEDISFQTNLLALNAAVEAARAGEHGKGFAVVADAVRSLAQRSSVAAKEISTLISDSSKNTKDSLTRAEQGKSLFVQIIESVQKLSELNDEIALGSKKQSAGVRHISETLNKLDLVSQTNAKSANQFTGTADKLTSDTLALTQSMNELSKLAG